jgi:hypothetical protein
MSEKQPACLACGKTADETPLLTLTYQGQSYYICPTDFPTLIHQPQKLAGKLPGAEKLTGHNH